MSLTEILDTARPFFFSIVCTDLSQSPRPKNKIPANRRRGNKIKVSKAFRGVCGALWALRHVSGAVEDDSQSLHHLNMFRETLLSDSDTIPPEIATQLLCAMYPSGPSICFAARKLGLQCWIVMNGCLVRCGGTPAALVRIMGQTFLVTQCPSAEALENIQNDCLDVTEGLRPCGSYKSDDLQEMFRKLFPNKDLPNKKEMYAYIASKVGKLT